MVTYGYIVCEVLIFIRILFTTRYNTHSHKENLFIHQEFEVWLFESQIVEKFHQNVLFL
jgi:hypothetical protein